MRTTPGTFIILTDTELGILWNTEELYVLESSCPPETETGERRGVLVFNEIDQRVEI